MQARILTLAILISLPLKAADGESAERLRWFEEARFGCFVHWGVYSVLGNEWHGKRGGTYAEHIQRVLKIPMADYRRDAVERFNPVKFNADEWISLVHRAGMRYFVITSKHHDGFAMFDSKASDYNVVKASPWHHDPMKDLKAACDRQGVHFGFYYSHAFDWGQEHSAGNDWEWQNPGGDKLLGGRDWWLTMPDKLADVRINYVDKKAIPQIRELIANYHPDILWFDTPQKLPYEENLRILHAVREAGPKVVVNGRLARNGHENGGDYISTGDRAIEFPQTEGIWETVPTTNESYGWNPLDNSHKTPEMLIHVLAKAVSRGGNVLLNVGPMPDGRIDPKDVAILEGIGRWMNVNEPSIRGCGRAPIPVQPWGVVTAHERRLYLHVFAWPKGDLVVGGLESVPAKAWMLADTRNSPLKLKRSGDHDLAIALPASPSDSADSVIVLEFNEVPRGGGVRLLSSGQGVTNQLLAFDAEENGRGFGHGDGKANRYYVTGFTSTEQSLEWTVRLDKPAHYAVALLYGKGTGTGKYELSIDDWKAERAVSAEAKIDKTYTESLGQIDLPIGLHHIYLRPREVQGGEVLRPLELQLR